MKFCRWLSAMLLTLLPVSAQAISLRWASGADTMSFAQPTRCVLVVRADAAEGRLPAEWRLLWLADSSGVDFVAEGATVACASDTALVSTAAPAATPADSAAHLLTTQFCSAGSSAASLARFVLDQPGGSQARFKVVALDPNDPDSSRVIESNEVTTNGGVEGEYAPAILRATTTHETRELRVAMVGTGLTAASSLRITAPDRVWSVPLEITAQSDSALVGSADVPTPLPSGVVEARTSVETVSLSSYPADQLTLAPALLPDTILYRDPDADVYPKDFAFYYSTVPTSDPAHPWKGLFHLIYIRHFRTSGAEPSLAHAWSENLTNWRVNTNAFLPNTGWDAQFVWAPSIVQVGNLHYMFYTGVDASGNQRIGYATTGLLDTTNTVWQRQSIWAYSADSTGWADPTAQGIGAQQFRDPFLMPDPDSSGRFLLFNVGQDKNYGAAARTVVGVARNRPGTLARWIDLGSYRDTDYGHTGITTVESPLVARDSSGAGTWRIYFANAWWILPGHNSTYLVTSLPGTRVADTTAGQWSDTLSLYNYLAGNSGVRYWQACEHLQIGNVHLFAAYNGSGIGITRTFWNGNDFVIGYPDLTAVEGAGAAADVRFYAAHLRPGAQSVRFVVDAPTPIRPRLDLHDLAGRRLKTLVDGRELQGRREIVWDCRDAQGVSVPTGMYFARLTGVGTTGVLRVPVIR